MNEKKLSGLFIDEKGCLGGRSSPDLSGKSIELSENYVSPDGKIKEKIISLEEFKKNEFFINFSKKLINLEKETLRYSLKEIFNKESNMNEINKMCSSEKGPRATLNEILKIKNYVETILKNKEKFEQYFKYIQTLKEEIDKNNKLMI